MFYISLAATLSEKDADVLHFLPATVTPYWPTSAAVTLHTSNLKDLSPSAVRTFLLDETMGCPSLTHDTTNKIFKCLIIGLIFYFYCSNQIITFGSFICFTYEDGFLALGDGHRLRENFESWTFHFFVWNCFSKMTN